MMPTLTPGFMAPILWGLAQGYTPQAIAEGLELEPGQVLLLIAAHRACERQRALARPRPVLRIDPYRGDARYANWARQAAGAAHTLNATGAFYG